MNSEIFALYIFSRVHVFKRPRKYVQHENDFYHTTISSNLHFYAFTIQFRGNTMENVNFKINAKWSIFSNTLKFIHAKISTFTVTYGKPLQGTVVHPLMTPSPFAWTKRCICLPPVPRKKSPWMRTYLNESP